MKTISVLTITSFLCLSLNGFASDTDPRQHLHCVKQGLAGWCYCKDGGTIPIKKLSNMGFMDLSISCKQYCGSDNFSYKACR